VRKNQFLCFDQKQHVEEKQHWAAIPPARRMTAAIAALGLVFRKVKFAPAA
jgi:hypothetical protein